MYKTREGYDKFKVERDNGHTKTRGKATYSNDGSLERLSMIHPQGGGRHDHEVINKKDDGTYEHLYFPDHKDH